MRQDASASPSPYPSQAVLRSSSFSGSDGHRSSSSDIEDGSGLVSTVPGNGLYGYHAHPGAVTQTAHPHSIYGQPPPQQHHDYSAAAAAMYAQPNRSHSGLSINSASTGHHSTIASMDVMSTGTVPGSGMSSMGAYGVPGRTMVPDQGLEQLAANVRAATTTSASDRAKHIFVQAWLNANYAPYQDGNVPRQGLYNSYRRVCDEYRIPHVNTATLGKAIRLCFPAIKTRRLGVRGNSKYHCA
ncbi:hypothetical protein DL93DRAFT_215361 [Clavulina sp. PMI_390]|nr:hypothetical protein DL93DRAFT_215361 [Clavulina sp. PMI_390]